MLENDNPDFIQKPLSQERPPSPKKEVVKRLNFDQDGLKRTSSLFEKFSGATHVNPLKRKAVIIRFMLDF